MKTPNPYARSPLDFVLAGVACMSALVSTGIALAQIPTGIVFALLAAVGLWFSYLADRNAGERTNQTDGLLMAAACICAVAFVRQLNMLMPLGGYPPELLTSSVLSWMVVLSAFFAWRDSTLLFLMVPSIAMFGLVGAYDTFRAASAVFFLFLVSLAVLFARAHLRHSLKFAEQDGHEAPQLRRYEWSALAGPEWALGSALAVVALSAVGAPVIQNSVQGVTSNIQVDNSALRAIRRNAENQVGENTSNKLPVGRGPLSATDDAEVLLAEAPAPMLLRQKHYASFEGGNWNSWSPPRWPASPTGTRMFDVSDAGYVATPGSFENTTIRLRAEFRGGGTTTIPYLGEPIMLRVPRSRAYVALDGSVTVDFPLRGGDRMEMVGFLAPAAKPESKSRLPMEYPRELTAAYQEFESTETVAEFARRITENVDGDYAKALRLKQEVTQTITYNLNAPAVPAGEDPVETVMFRSQQGYCDLYATALAQMARSVGLSARVATGFLMDPRDMVDGKYVVRQRHAHMWTEIYFEDVGWVSFDATEGAAQVPGAGRGQRRADSRNFWDRLQDPVFAQIATFIMMGLAGIAAAWVGWRIWLAQRGRGRMLLVKPAFAPVELAVGTALRKIEKASGVPRRFEWTAREYLEQVSPGLLNGGALASLLDQALYSPQRASIDEIEQGAKDFLAAAFPPQSKAS